MPRSHARAKAAGTEMEVWTVEHLRRGLWRLPFAEFIQRRTKTGAKDRGDVANVRLPDGRVLVIEVKNTAKPTIGPWLKEAETERLNDEAAAAVVVYKRHGIGRTRMGEQVVTCTLDDLIVILGGERMSQGGTS
jgi:hypothetical protein